MGDIACFFLNTDVGCMSFFFKGIPLHFLGLLLLWGGLLDNGVSAYNWQQHVPEHAKPFVPSEKNAQSKNNVSTFGVSSISGNTSISTHHGPLTLTQAEVDSNLTVFGPLSAQETEFKKDLTCHGPVTLSGNKNRLHGSVQIMGPLFANSTIFEGPVTIFGYIEAQNSHFKKTITIHTSKVVLKNTQIEDLIIDDRKNDPVEVSFDNVQVKGKITIASGQGVVSLKSCQISKEKITGYKTLITN